MAIGFGVVATEEVLLTPVYAPGYRALREDAAWLDLSARGKTRVTGEDRARLLHAMTTQQIQKMELGDGGYAFFLNAQGRILGDVFAFCCEEYFLLDTEPETQQKLYEHIDRYIIADDVTLEDVTALTATIGIEGPRATAALERLGAPIPESDCTTRLWSAEGREWLIAKVSSTGTGGYRIFLPASQKDVLISQLAAIKVPQATATDARTVRIEHGMPRYGEELSDRYLVQETGQLQAVSFTKGCYLGQEIVERVRSRAQIHRVLKQLEIHTTVAPAPESKLTSGETAAGEIVSSAFSPASGKVAAMAYVRVQFAEPGAELSVGEARAHVI